MYNYKNCPLTKAITRGATPNNLCNNMSVANTLRFSNCAQIIFITIVIHRLCILFSLSFLTDNIGTSRSLEDYLNEKYYMKLHSNVEPC